MIIVGVFSRAAFWMLAIYIVGSFAVPAWGNGEFVLAVFSVILFPITYLLYPWFGDLVIAFIISILAYMVSTFIGGLSPVDWPPT